MGAVVTHHLDLRKSNVESFLIKSWALWWTFNPIQDGHFWDCSQIGGKKGPPVPIICHTYPTMMKLGTFISYLEKIQKIYESEFWRHRHFFTGNQQILLCQEIQREIGWAFLGLLIGWGLTLFRMAIFGVAHGWGEGWAKRPLSLKNVTHIVKWWNLAQLYLTWRRSKNIYESRETPPEFYWHRHFFTGNQQILLYQEIQVKTAFW